MDSKYKSLPLPIELHHELKLLAVQKSMSMINLIKQMIEQTQTSK